MGLQAFKRKQIKLCSFNCPFADGNKAEKKENGQKRKILVFFFFNGKEF